MRPLPVLMAALVGVLLIVIFIWSGLHTDGAIWRSETVRAGHRVPLMAGSMPLIVACVDSVARLHADGSVDIRPLKPLPDNGCTIYGPAPQTVSVSNIPDPHNGR